MARGITQDQVSAVAETILYVGENPTVEKVRAALGTGSPNTITRMLETWRGQLGDRLRQLSTLPEVPVPVGQAMVDLWRLAIEHAKHALDEHFSEENALLETAQAQLAQERGSWEQRLQVAETSLAQARAARDLAEHACNTLDGQLEDSHALRSDLQQQRDRLQVQYDQQATLLQSLRSQLDEHQAAMEAERERRDTHLRAVEDRAHLEVDRARQEAKQWQQRWESSERTSREVHTEMQSRIEMISDRARHLEQELASKMGQVTALEKALAEARFAAKTKPQQSKATAKVPAKRGQRPKSSARSATLKLP
ncbi:DNA-binding protein [Dyella telluris]|uniref:DNA-binding protein n=1 Tax=Dyella telluris TaxID=2763498 RepID=A0A7G8Q3L7_9GAMM|nr:DNA-binding protein [Dyella telluris]QNK01375.1 DNA-binding protein [Dyella telluris]